MNKHDEIEIASRGTWKQLRIGFDEAAARLPEVLQNEGFGVITQIDLRETFKAKLGIDFRRYRIFGACNPTFAMRALVADPHVGLLLPCNLALYERDDKVAVLGVIDPIAQLGASDGHLAELAKTIAERLSRVAARLDQK
jgi:uncharacterized protein (DUF302 family)